MAHAQHTPELAWWLVTSEEDEAKRMREQAILLLMPNMNPDGLDIVRDWYNKNLGTPFETTATPMLYHHYIGHDNNRDWYMFTQVESKAVARQLYHEWFPQIVYNHHQSSPFPGRIWGPPMKNPVNPNLDPLIVSTINQIGEAMRKRFDEEEKPGYNSNIQFDMWWNGSMRGAPDFHNMAGFLTETALYRYATPKCYTAEEVPDTFGERHGNMPAKTPSTNYTNPWLGGCWPLRQPVEYMLTASRATLDLAAKLKEDFLFNIWRMGTRQIARGEKAQGGPYAYVIDLAAQHDPTRTVELLRTFRHGRRRDPARGCAVHGRRQAVSGGHVRDRAAAVPAVRHRSDGAEDVSGAPAVSGRSARSAVRHDRLRAALPDGRHGRSRDGSVPAAVDDRRRRAAGARRRRGNGHGGLRAVAELQSRREGDQSTVEGRREGRRRPTITR